MGVFNKVLLRVLIYIFLRVLTVYGHGDNLRGDILMKGEFPLEDYYKFCDTVSSIAKQREGNIRAQVAAASVGLNKQMVTGAHEAFKTAVNELVMACKSLKGLPDSEQYKKDENIEEKEAKLVSDSFLLVRSIVSLSMHMQNTYDDLIIVIKGENPDYGLSHAVAYITSKIKDSPESPFEVISTAPGLPPSTPESTIEASGLNIDALSTIAISLLLSCTL
ncbi:hypothetical protein BgAZ_305570 [Babesia gibsoni]|uniref:Uncharacterized protein n=1 Tax=Babesia gibsoni TaxID=33632 RepID=A0AAD8LIW2_BABGI|nr:hypothetical protein BgAZ_305570 [Babesia gibsoni]